MKKSCRTGALCAGVSLLIATCSQAAFKGVLPAKRRSKNSALRNGLAVLALLASQTLPAAPVATLEFRDPTGTVGPTDSIEVWVTLALDAGSDAITTDSSGTVTSGYDSGDYPLGFTVTSSNLNVSFLCSGTFTSVCTDPPPYSFAFNSGADNFSYAADLDLQPGESQDFLFGTFTPDPSPAPAGTYVYYDTSFFIQLNGVEDGNPAAYDVPIASTCPSQENSCAFTRTVVPLPPAIWLFGTGLLGLVGIARRRKAV